MEDIVPHSRSNAGIKKRSPAPARVDRSNRALGQKSNNVPPGRHGPKAALRKAPAQSSDVTDLRARLRTMVKRRHDPDTKFFDLSSLGKDPELENTGMFETQSRGAKFFPAFMSVCETVFPTPYKRREAVVSVSLAGNNLPSVANVTTLAQTFPHIKNIDLSNNNLGDLKALEPWSRKFKFLDHLILTGNPIETVPDFHLELMKWYPNLRMIDSVQVRSDEELSQSHKKKRKSIPVLPPNFRDQDGIAENFVVQFFPAFDTNRVALINHYYGPTSTFSVSVNTHARAINKDVLAPWEAWIKKSRNLTKITSQSGRKSRIFQGVDEIRDTWLSLPGSLHPDPLLENEKWCIECHGIPGLPDPTGNSSTGVGGLIIILHGEFGELNATTGQEGCRRSFDRTFILGPGNTPSGIQVLNDMLAVRAYGGYEAFKPTVSPHQSPRMATQSLPAPILPTTTVNNVEFPPGLVAPPGFGLPAADKTPERVQQELLALELSKATRMTLDFSVMCLTESNWNLQQAGQTFESNRVNVPPEAFW
ncbi:MAG: hypothetical protein LQ340_006884 [Diploschistes diacapsis]|nr:MAG: hypothetical protein LQ340_006884 [Diploschistes diacapsis]